MGYVQPTAADAARLREKAMSTPKPGAQPGRAMGTERDANKNDELERSLDENLAVQGQDDTESDADPSGEEGLEALEDNNGDAFGEADDEEDVIPLPDETLNRGSRRP